MENTDSSLQIKSLQFSSTDEDYLLYKAALEWDLIDPIVIENRNDLKSEHMWRDKVEPYRHQVENLITFCRRLPVTLLADDVGLGKTISAGLVISELVSRGRLSKILIVCPKILGPQWKEELDTKFGISSIVVTGADLLTAKFEGEVGAIITTYQSARLYLDQISNANFDMLILDEAHKLRNLHGTNNPPKVAQEFKKVLSDRVFKYVLMLTATPIQNRLWDLYSLVDLLTVARGHENPFGTPGIFARKFIVGNREEARQLNLGAQDEFRSVVYGYMSRVRRGDADLHFPQREVQLHQVEPKLEEIELFKVVSGLIKGLNRLTQIGILKTLVSSPEALTAQLKNMVINKTIKESFAKEVIKAASKISITAKLEGLGVLINKLRAENPTGWRVVIFTTRIETQTTIHNYLEKQNIPCGIINGKTGSINQETIGKFKKDIPQINVIISTEAGSEGVNLQAANVLVNYDLPWNPMIVEQRIGRVQRLGSKYEKVCIFNIVLKGTFEEYIVGRLMEKLQMASHAIGDIESLLQASGMADGDDQVDSFENKILQLVLASLEGKDVDKATNQAIKSISDAKIQLETEEKNINMLLGKMDSTENGPKCPQLPSAIHSIDAQNFVLKGLRSLGAELSPKTATTYLSLLDGQQELICLDNSENNSSEGVFSNTLYSPGSPAFDRLVAKLTSKGLHRVQDADQNILVNNEKMVEDWVKTFNGIYQKSEVKEARKCFSGFALVRVRMTVAHDSYERLVEIACNPDEHHEQKDRNSLDQLDVKLINDPSYLGINTQDLIQRALQDNGVSEFCRFYRERLAEELKSTGDDSRKKKKAEDDFTPRIELRLVGIEGFVCRQLLTTVSYKIDSDDVYKSTLKTLTCANQIIQSPKMAECGQTNKSVPQECLSKCDISELKVLNHLLIKSEISDRKALPSYLVKCSMSGKQVLSDEVEKSIISGNFVISNLLKESDISGKKAEPRFFGRCDFTSSEVLETELLTSQVSGKKYRMDEQSRSVVSGKTGYKQEFILCSETNNSLLPDEAERCQITGKILMPGLLERCDVSSMKVLPTELEKSTVSGKKALKKYFISSSLSGARLLEDEAIKSITGNFCVPAETKICAWSNRECHPDDIRICDLTALPIYFKYVLTKDDKSRLEPLSNLLDGISRKSDQVDLWPDILLSVNGILGKKSCNIEEAQISPDEEVLAVCVKVKTLFGFKVRYAGLLYSIKNKTITGRIAMGQRETMNWVRT